jgi:hypothetical protein
MLRRTASLLAAALFVGVWGSAAGAQTDDEASLAGSTDIPGGSVITLAQGTSIPALHHVIAENLEDQPIRVRFEANSPPGVDFTPEQTDYTIPVGGKVEARFAITVGAVVPPGDYPIVVQLVRSDIEPVPGQVTNVPAIGARFTLQVTGDAGTLTVRAVSSVDGQPVEGTLVVSTVLEDGAAFEVTRTLGSTLTATVAPGTYKAAFLLAERELTSQQVQVAANQTAEAVLEVETVSFVLVDAQPVKEHGKIVTADLVASVQNQVTPIEGGVTLRAQVFRGDRHIDTITLYEFPTLASGVTEANATYRPDQGFKPGTYRFTFELVTPDFTLRAASQPTINVPKPFPLLRTVLLVAALLLLAVATGLWLRRRRARTRRPPSAPKQPPPATKRLPRPHRTPQHKQPTLQPIRWRSPSSTPKASTPRTSSSS